MSQTASTSELLLSPGDAGWDAARRASDLSQDQRPAAIAVVASADEIADAVRYAAEHDLRVVAQAGGHAAATLGDLSDALLIRTTAMTGITVDVGRRRARVQAGATWGDLVRHASVYDLAPRTAVSPDRGVVGSILAGGTGWLARADGLAADAVVAVEVVTADGSRVRADARREPDLFWALRGGGGGFGVVTAVELELRPASFLYGGTLLWPIADAARVLDAWRAWLPGLPDEMSTIARLVREPDVHCSRGSLPGGDFVAIELVFAGHEEDAVELLRPLRALEPEIDTCVWMPASGLAAVHGGHEDPAAVTTDHLLLDELPHEAVTALLMLAGPDSGSPLRSVELRHLGGALTRPAPESGALGVVDGEFAVVATGTPRADDDAQALAAHTREVIDALAPWAIGRSLLELAGRPTDPRRAFRPPTRRRLAEIRAAADPDGRFA